MSQSRKGLIWALGTGAVALASIGLVVFLVAARPGDGKDVPQAQERADEQDQSNAPIRVKATHPRKDASLRVTVRQLLSVEPFFETELRSQVAGVVRRVPKSIGARVHRGDLLVEIAVPDLESEVHRATSALSQARARVAQMKAYVTRACADLDTAVAAIVQAEASYKSAGSMRSFRSLQLERIKRLVVSKSIEEKLEEETREHFEAALEKENAARAAIATTRAQKVAAEARIEQAEADVVEAEAKINVVKAEIEKARAMLEFAHITAPFDGAVVSRYVVEGTFVQNASTSHTDALLSLARTDIVTVVMHVPDNAAPYVTQDTEAILSFDEFPGVKIRGRVTRFAPAIRDKDRTLRVEVDLWNETPEKYNRFAAKCVGTWLTALAAKDALRAVPLLTASEETWSKDCKDRADPFPVLPVIVGRSDTPVKILPGMSGYMRLMLQQFKDAYLLPSSAVFSRGGKPYILEVKDGKSHLVPVRTQVGDGRLIKVALIAQEGDPSRGKPEILTRLTGKEVIILSRQVEIGDGQPVEVSIDD